MDALADSIAQAERELSDRTLKIGAALTLGGALLGALASKSFYGTLVGASAGSLAASWTAFFLTSTEITTSTGDHVTVRPIKLGTPFALAAGIAALGAYFAAAQGRKR